MSVERAFRPHIACRQSVDDHDDDRLRPARRHVTDPPPSRQTADDVCAVPPWNGMNMARIDWTLMCDHAFLDRHNRLCVIGMIEQLCVASLPLTMGRVTLFARLVDVHTVDEFELMVAVITPLGTFTVPTSADGIQIEVASGYVFATLSGMPLTEEGIYSFQLSLSGQPAVSLDIPVLTTEGATTTGVN